MSWLVFKRHVPGEDGPSLRTKSHFLTPTAQIRSTKTKQEHVVSHLRFYEGRESPLGLEQVGFQQNREKGELCTSTQKMNTHCVSPGTEFLTLQLIY